MKHSEEFYHIFYGYMGGFPKTEFQPRSVVGINCEYGIGYEEQPIKWARKKGYLTFKRGFYGWNYNRITGAYLTKRGQDYIKQQAIKRKHFKC